MDCFDFLRKSRNDGVQTFGTDSIIKNNPYFGANIKKLKGEYKEIYRFRIGDYRLFYKIDEIESIIFIVNIENRKDTYK